MIVRHTSMLLATHAGHALDILLGLAPLPKATEEFGQCLGTILHRDGNLGRVNVGI
jgi:hypothetical protein